MDDKKEEYQVAVASSDGIVVNQHFGRARKFYIYKVTKKEVSYIEEREVTPVCQGGTHEEKELETTVNQLADCQYLLLSRIGEGARSALAKKGITAMELPGLIEESIYRVVSYVEVQKLFL